MKTEADLSKALAKWTVYGIILAAVVILAGGAYYDALHWREPIGDHVFKGEPSHLTHPVAMVKRALEGGPRSIALVGVMLLLLNPIVRVLLLALGYASMKDRLFAVISSVVFFVLCCSFFL